MNKVTDNESSEQAITEYGELTPQKVSNKKGKTYCMKTYEKYDNIKNR